ncbi:hypothetical protein QWY82_10225 [Simiduia curdlanivorans]|uniref:Uncharacterized protein n=1 Tax=Simiduia curdlanivorans TaxID=1492769 RepID=A0ABV8V0S1_9GAMM|nr:hypothetical protein [Simiduia curdlanivorans]MDN3639186.1 hypothetical protein [Simiduia curdlanivorans]
MKTFSDHAYDKLIDLFNNHDKEVGSELKKQDPIKYKDFKSTDCITYSLNVISHAFNMIGNTDAESRVWKLGGKGTDLAKYLVNSHNWKGIYINPDAKHPVDSNAEHTYTSHIAAKKCSYYQIPLEYKVENYSVTSKSHSAFQKLNKSTPETKLNDIDITSLEQVKFGFGISRGGMHTWVFSNGKVYEVHWDKIGAELYEATMLRTFPWISGAIVVPFDQAAKLSASSKLKCGT